jgi:hypothetical protein
MNRWLRSFGSCAFVAVFVASVSACGGAPEPKTPSLSDPAGAGVDAAGAPPVDPAVANAGIENAPHRQRKPFPIHSSCSDVVTIAFGEDPKAADSGHRTIAPNSEIDGPRDADGNQTVWLLDDKGEPIVKVHVTRGMKQLEIGRSCRTLDAR